MDLINVLTIIYGFCGIITFLGFLPTIRDLWNNCPSANLSTYLVWGFTTFITFLYALLVVQDFMFTMVIALQLLAIVIVLILKLRLEMANTKNF